MEIHKFYKSPSRQNETIITSQPWSKVVKFELIAQMFDVWHLAVLEGAAAL